MSKGVELIAAERQRQIEVEGYDAKHDEDWVEGELAIAAACYAVAGTEHIRVIEDNGVGHFDAWPFGGQYDKRQAHDEIRCLIIAGALIAAEIDRLRAEKAGNQND